MTDENEPGIFERGLSRRDLLKRAGVGAGGLALFPALAEKAWARPLSHDAGNTIKVGFVSPRTGPAAGFGEPDPYVISLARKAFAKGLTVKGKHYSVQVLDRDSQSKPSRAAQVANNLIHGSGIDLMLATSTPENNNPVCDACEAAGVPAVSTVEPWEAWYFGRGAKPGKPSPFRYTFHFCFGVHEFDLAYTHLWPQVKTNKKVGVMWPNDADGNAIRASLGPELEKAGYKIVDPGGYADGTNDYSSQIAKFKAEKVQIFNTFPIPPDFITFWRQASQQGLVHQIRIAQIAKTGLFPSQVRAAGKLGAGLASACYWHPTWPYKSSLTGVTSKQLGAGYTKKTGRQWNQQLGPSLALFDVAAAVLRASGNPKDKKAVAAAMRKLQVQTPVGRLHWGTGPVANIVATPIPGGQWVAKKGRFPVDFVICEHSADRRIPIGGRLKAYRH
jgi:branched-chain amino acid transport system substrate-binding protein